MLVAGSIALDTLDGPFGHVQGELGGSALYFSLAASLIGPVRMVAPVGTDGIELVKRAVGDRPIDLGGLTQVSAPTYRWQATQFEGRNLDLGSQDSIYDVWEPAIADGFEGWAFVGSMRPDRQVEAARSLITARLLAADAMRSYVQSQPAEAKQLLDLCDWYFCNHEEFEALGGDLQDPDRFRSDLALRGLFIKEGPDGVWAWTPAGPLHVPALLTRRVLDTTGAGDSLAGGTLARWLQLGGRPECLEEALIHGVACASLAIEEVGVRGIAAATPAALRERVDEVRKGLLQSRQKGG